jgi:hypothetical protein
MKIYLAGSGIEKICWANRNFFNFNRLESFVYLSEFEKGILSNYDNFLLDSGAFTYLNKNKNKKFDWENYVKQYAEFIRTKNIKTFFELDIDPIVGLKEVERLRDVLENTAERKCIPVWHKSRGLDYWKKMVKEYNYVAIGGIVTQEIKRTQYDIFLPLLKIAKENNCKVHGLGFTNLKGMEKYKFYSVDSTSWLSGNKFGSVYLFDGKTMQKQNKLIGQRVKTNEVLVHNFSEWVKFSKYAEQNL